MAAMVAGPSLALSLIQYWWPLTLLSKWQKQHSIEMNADFKPKKTPLLGNGLLYLWKKPDKEIVEVYQHTRDHRISRIFTKVAGS